MTHWYVNRVPAAAPMSLI